MSNLHRIQWIDAQIRAKRFPNCRLIAEAFEISARQASRDIEYMRYSMGAPVEYSTGKNGYYYTDEAYALPQYYISEEEKKALNYLAYRYSAINSSQTVRLAELFSRLVGPEQLVGKTSESLPVYDVNPKVVDVFNMLNRAIDGFHRVRLHYLNARNEMSIRLFSPYKLFGNRFNNYVVGFCELKNDIRVFRLDRIRLLELLESSFVVSPLFNEKDYGAEVPFNYVIPYTCTIKSDKPPNFGKLKFTAAQNGERIYTVEFYNSDELLNLLLSQSARFSILSPGWLRDKLKDRLQKLFDSNFS